MVADMNNDDISTNSTVASDDTASAATTTRSVRDIIRARRATRKYTGNPLPEKDVREFLDLILEAPSAFNLQQWSMIAVQSEEAKEKLSAAAGHQKQVKGAPLVLVFVAEPSAWQRHLSELIERNLASGLWDEEFAENKKQTITNFQQVRAAAGLSREFAIRDAMIAASFAMVAAVDFGWATSLMTGFDEAAVKEALNIEPVDDTAVALLLAVGEPAEEPTPPGRFTYDDMVHQDYYQPKGQ